MRRRAAEMTQATRRRRGSTGATSGFGGMARGSSPLANTTRPAAAEDAAPSGEGASAEPERAKLPSFAVLEAAAPAHAVHPRLMAAVGGAGARPQRATGADPVFSSSVCLEFTVGDTVDAAAHVDANVATPSDDEDADSASPVPVDAAARRPGLPTSSGDAVSVEPTLDED